MDTPKMSRKKRILAISGILLLFAAIGIAYAAVNRYSNNEMISQLEERYGTKFEFLKDTTEKTGDPDDIEYSLTASCPDLPGKEIHASKGQYYYLVSSDYIYQKYGDDAGRAIKDALSATVPDAKIIPMAQNTFSGEEYDAGTSLEDYLAGEKFAVYVLVKGDTDKEKLRTMAVQCSGALKDAGIGNALVTAYACDGAYFDSAAEPSGLIPADESGEIPDDAVIDKAER